MRTVLTAIMFAMTAACSAAQTGTSDQRPVPRTDAEIAFAKATLANLQALSFERGREYCGYIGIDDSGAYVATKPRKGQADSCYALGPQSAGFTVLASYHTHGAYGLEYDSEIPSYEDLETDFDDGIDGYIATPGGRFWLVDVETRTARLICAKRCLPRDPNYLPFLATPVRKTYTLDELEPGEFTEDMDVLCTGVC